MVANVNNSSSGSSWRSVLDALAHINNNDNKHQRHHIDDDHDDDDARNVYTRSVVRNHKTSMPASTSARRSEDKDQRHDDDMLDRARFFTRQADAARSTVERLESRAAELTRKLEEREEDARSHAETDERVRLIEDERARAEDRSRASESASFAREDRLSSQESLNRDLASELVALKESLSAAHALARSRAAAEDAAARAREDNARLLALLAATGEYGGMMREWEEFEGGATYLPHHAEYTSLVNTYHTDANALEHTRPVCAKREADEWVPTEAWSAAQSFARAHMSSSSQKEVREALRELVVSVSDCWRRAACARARRDNERHRKEVTDLRRQIAHGVAYEEVVRPASSSSSLLASGVKKAGGSTSTSTSSSSKATGVFVAKTRQLAASVGNLSVVARASQRMSEEVAGDCNGGGGGDDELACARVCGQLARKTAAATQDLINDVADILTQLKAKLQLQAQFAEGLHGAVHRCYTQARAAYGAALESSGFDRDKAGRFASAGGGSVNITSNSKVDEGVFRKSGHAGCAHDDYYDCGTGVNNNASARSRSTCSSPGRW
eukprot:jgi/Chlat1/4802/Chrsp31S04794